MSRQLVIRSVNLLLVKQPVKGKMFREHMFSPVESSRRAVGSGTGGEVETLVKFVQGYYRSFIKRDGGFPKGGYS